MVHTKHMKNRMVTIERKQLERQVWIKSPLGSGGNSTMSSKSSFFGKYKAAFLLPLGAKKTLGEDGWVFVGRRHLGPDVLDFLIRLLGLVLEESYLDMERYVGNNLQATVVYDDEGKIEHVDFQVYDDARKQLELAFTSSDLRSSCELFFPD